VSHPEPPPGLLSLHRAFWEHMPVDVYLGDQQDREDTLIYCTCGEQMSYRVEFAGHMANVANEALGIED